ncbi:MAG: patatin-like phospholipase family protein [Balneolaceae bacterium]
MNDCESSDNHASANSGENRWFLSQIWMGTALMILSVSLACPALSQSRLQESAGDLQVGVALSGGGAKGIAHVGALRVLEEAGIQIDYIAGTSMGSIVGALYSIGYTPDEMEEIANSTDWEALFTDRPGRRYLSMFEKEVDEQFIASFPISERGINLPQGVVAGQNIASWLNRYLWPSHHINDFSQLPIPFSTVATDIETGEAVVLNSGFLPEAIRASISLPSLLMPYKLNGKTLMDGGLARNLPVEDLFEMGADYVIAIDVTTPLRSAEELQSIVLIQNQAVNFRVHEKMGRQKELADLVLDIGGLEAYTIADFDEAATFIRQGEESARERMEEFRSIAGRQQSRDVQLQQEMSSDRITITGVSVKGNERVPSDFILAELGFQEGDVVNDQSIEESISRLYSTRLFNLIMYKMQVHEGDYHLHFRVIESTDDTFRVGARYEDETQASLLLHASFRNLLQRGSTLRFDSRLGRELQFQGEYLYFRGVRSRLGVRLKSGYYGDEIDYYSGGDRISSVRNHLVLFDLFSGTFMNSHYLAGLGIRRDFIHFTREINPDGIPFTDRDHHSAYALLWVDTFNRRSYPTQGQRVYARASFSDPMFLSPLTYSTQTLYWKAWYSAADWLSIQHTLYAGRSTGTDLPWRSWYSLNRYHDLIGFARFGGYGRNELTGRNLQMVSVGIQAEIARHQFLRLDAYAGNVFDTWNWNLPENRFKTGYSLSAGILTILGPIEAIFSASSRNPFIFELQIGYEF